MISNLNASLFADSAEMGNVFPVFTDKYGAAKLAALLQLGESQWWSPDQLLEHQFSQLDNLMKHAWREVPFYRERFRHIGFNPEIDAISPENFSRIPVLKRQDVQDAGDKLKAANLPPGHGNRHPIRTSGSTGRAVEFEGTQLVMYFWQAFTLRDHLWHRRDLEGKLAALRWAGEDEGLYPGTSRNNWGIAAEHVFNTGPGCFLHIKTETDKQIKWLLDQQPQYLITFPSQLSVLADHFLYADTKLTSLKGLICVGETLSDELREKCRRVWDIEPTDFYTCEEVGYIALQCPDHTHYHVQSENVIVEVLNENDQPCQPGETGRVLVTSLHNFATPIIRYELGDYALVGEPCPCGRGLPVLKKIMGRSRNRLALPGGQHTFPYFGNQEEYMEVTTAIRQYQIIQETLEDIEVKLVVAEPITKEQEDELKKVLLKHLGHKFNIHVSYMDHIPKGSRGKFEEFISRVS